VLNARQASRVVDAVNNMSDADHEAFKKVLDGCGSDTERALVYKALAAGRSLADVTAFAGKIKGKDDAWLAANTAIVPEGTPMDTQGNTGVSQMWINSCGPTSIQIVHALNDPIYALDLTAAGNVNNAGGANAKARTEQGNMLTNQGVVAEPFGMVGATGSGIWVEQDLNNMEATTGLKYDRQLINQNKQDEVDGAVDTIVDKLDEGMPVPLVVGDATRQNAHYVVALRREGSKILIHDPGNGTTTWVNEDDIRSGSIPNNAAAGWTQLHGFSNPSG
jgi:hypothetical protein